MCIYVYCNVVEMVFICEYLYIDIHVYIDIIFTRDIFYQLNSYVIMVVDFVSEPKNVISIKNTFSCGLQVVQLLKLYA